MLHARDYKYLISECEYEKNSICFSLIWNGTFENYWFLCKNRKILPRNAQNRATVV